MSIIAKKAKKKERRNKTGSLMRIFDASEVQEGSHESLNTPDSKLKYLLLLCLFSLWWCEKTNRPVTGEQFCLVREDETSDSC